MCVPVSVATAGKVSGCQGLCSLWPQISALVVLGAGLVWNFTWGFGSRESKEPPMKIKEQPMES
ncbi:hypothetical protein DSCO28_25180 [Desulfosarcina ovata subsp. sediminis]|uniref:Uncharacterized protein n=2 Tax=Desulfosarcina ovata TaxID=83564 RepID=A0A5K8AB45_9BACT|nr:hypothetical protein DSCO28_25180 [Desulfosarcina ovata subsp. sediminis]BBO89170.1 hypothetical protein DSCOOX_23500 [Desulfosarcina ovata subsp. ovata]